VRQLVHQVTSGCQNSLTTLAENTKMLPKVDTFGIILNLQSFIEFFQTKDIEVILYVLLFKSSNLLVLF
jgi:hypothetical protein